ncbi:MAG: 16S rRNA (guanine(966)-N(2))-methyltransferase RsmD [Devosia sp.]|nr:16S rRNA (guanine(966)-N(2))-methyltransferase RsmD [Devosia sp.]
MRIIAGKFRGKALRSPGDDTIRPTSDRARESIFDILSSRIGPNFSGLRVFDLFAGTGALGLEALSRGAAGVVFVDTSAEARGLIRDHIEAFGAGGVAKLLRRDATDLGPAGTMGPFNLVFLDPPYGKGLGEKALASLVAGKWLAPDAAIVFEESKDAVLNLPAGFTIQLRREYGAAAVRLLSFEQ